MMEEEVIQGCDPGIRATVRWLAEVGDKFGFEPTDSGDGITKISGDMEHVLEFPHVFCQLPRQGGESAFRMMSRAVAAAQAVSELLYQKGIMLDPCGGGPHVEISWNSSSWNAMIAVMNVDDSMLHAKN